MKLLLKLIQVPVLIVVFSTLNVQASSLETQAAAGTFLKIALIHFKVAYKQPDQNLLALKQLHREAAAKGAKLILNTELALSGYSFSSRADIRPFTRTLEDEDLKEMANLARELCVYIGITFPERDPETDSFYNAAAVFSPQGKLVLKYHKIYGEKRWARTGSPYQNNLFSTPWGRIGVAICADSYFGLIPRTLAIKGADLIWVPANWPPSGFLSPLDVWQTRALENGVYIAACNRTGKDRVMDCTKAVSAVIRPDGTSMFNRTSTESALFFARIPLNEEGKIKNSLRREKMALRKVDSYRQIYLDPWTQNLTQYYQLPKPGKLEIHCLTSASDGLDMVAVEKQVKAHPSSSPVLWVLPQAGSDDLDIKALKNLAETDNCAFALSLTTNDNKRSALLITAEEITPFMTLEGEFPYRVCHFGPAALSMVPMDELRHPELSVILAKLGCDLVLISEPGLSEADERVTMVRTIDNLALAAAGRDRAMIAHMEGVHGKVHVETCVQGNSCFFELDTTKTRVKTFYDRVDFNLLLKNGQCP